MPKVKNGPSKRKSSRQRHKIERKKREHKRDLRKAAKALKKSGLGPKRSKKSRELAKLALKVSNSHPDKEAILSKVLKAREDARVAKSMRRSTLADVDAPQNHEEKRPKVSQDFRKVFTYIPVRESNNFSYQFIRSLDELVFPLTDSSMQIPSAAYLVTLDTRFAVQSIPWGLLDSIVTKGIAYSKNGGKRKILLMFVLTKVDIVSASAVVTQISLVARAICERYLGVSTEQKFSDLSPCVSAAICPVSVHFEKTTRYLSRILRQFLASDECSVLNERCNMNRKLSTFVIGLPNTGRRTLTRTLLHQDGGSNISIVPVSAAQLQLISEDDTLVDENAMKFAFPNAKEITLLQFPQDAVLRRELSTITGGDIVFQSASFIEKITNPEAIGCMLFGAALDKVSLAQGFSLPIDLAQDTSNEEQQIKVAERFLRNLGQTVRRDKGFHVSPLFVSNAGTMGKLTSSSLTASVEFTSRQQSSQPTLLDASFSNATPNKLVRISSVIAPSRGKGKSNQTVKRADSHNALKLGARTFVREICQGKNIPWSVMRLPMRRTVTKEEVEHSSLMFDLSLCCGQKQGSVKAKNNASDHLNAILNQVSSLLKQYLVLLPNGVVEFDPDSIVAPTHTLNGDKRSSGDNEEEIEGVCEEQGEDEEDCDVEEEEEEAE